MTDAGWYPDPTGRQDHRYWDGAAWTEHVSKNGQQSTDPPVLATPEATVSQSPDLEGASVATPASQPTTAPETEASTTAAPVERSAVSGEGPPGRTPPGGFRGWSRGKRIAAMVGAAFIVLVVIAAIAGGTKKDSPSTQKSGSDAAAGDSSTSSSSTTTTTEPPTTTTTLPPPQVADGTGDDVIALSGSGPRTVVASYSGSSNFVIKGLDAANADTDLLVNTIGAYIGTTALDFDEARTASLQVTASGPWHIEVRNAAAAPQFAGTTSGHGDAVLVSTGPAGIATIANQGSSNFVVKTYASHSSADLLVNEIGNYSGRQPWPSGPSFVVIQSDGNWSITVP